MDIEEIKQHKIELENTITNSIESFMKNTHASVENVNIIIERFGTGELAIIRCSVDIVV